MITWLLKLIGVGDWPADQSDPVSAESPTVTVDRSGLTSPMGLRVALSTAPAEIEMPASHDRIELGQQTGTRRFKCGHEGPRQFVLSVYGEETRLITDRERCPACLMAYIRARVIRCAVCGFAISPGDGVAVYSAASGGLRLDIATRLDETEVLGCLRAFCCPSGGFFAGHWTSSGFRSAFTGGQGVAEIVASKAAAQAPSRSE